jgi:hypothetical protein
MPVSTKDAIPNPKPFAIRADATPVMLLSAIDFCSSTINVPGFAITTFDMSVPTPTVGHTPVYPPNCVTAWAIAKVTMVERLDDKGPTIPADVKPFVIKGITGKTTNLVP